MPLVFVRNDITKMDVDAIVNAANGSLLGGGGVDGAIHRAAGPELLEECRTLNGCRPGEAKITKGYRLPAKYVIHTVGPVYRDGLQGEQGLLRSCYRNSMHLAMENGCRTVAFPLISAGIFGYPREEAIQVASETITEELEKNEKAADMEVYLVLFGRDAFAAGRKLREDIQTFIDDTYVDAAVKADPRSRRNLFNNAAPSVFAGSFKNAAPAVFADSVNDAAPAVFTGGAPRPKKLSELAENLDESFQQMLMRKIAESGRKPSDVYHRANITKAHFSKINCDEKYQPKKKTVCALAIALELDLPETRELLMKAGFALSHSSMFDVIIEYFITNGRYNIYEVNEALFDYDQELLGV